MRCMRSRRAQIMAEYGVLLAIVITVAIACQQFIKARMQGANEEALSDYQAEVTKLVGSFTDFEPTKRTVDSDATTALNMTEALKGKVDVDTQSITTQLK